MQLFLKRSNSSICIVIFASHASGVHFLKENICFFKSKFLKRRQLSKRVLSPRKRNRKSKELSSFEKYGDIQVHLNLFFIYIAEVTLSALNAPESDVDIEGLGDAGASKKLDFDSGTITSEISVENTLQLISTRLNPMLEFSMFLH